MSDEPLKNALLKFTTYSESIGTFFISIIFCCKILRIEYKTTGGRKEINRELELERSWRKDEDRRDFRLIRNVSYTSIFDK